jgi:multiple sugar transport system permease protein
VKAVDEAIRWGAGDGVRGAAPSAWLTEARRRWIFAHALILPAALAILFLVIYPLLKIAEVSLRVGKTMSFARIGQLPLGLGNYVAILADPQFWHSARVSLLYVASSVALAFVLGLLTALLLDARLPAKRVFRVLILLPWAVPGVVASIVFRWMFDGSFGVVNAMLRNIGLLSGDMPWAVDARTALVVVILPTVWKAYPLITLTVLAALQTIPRELYEAAEVDGTNAWQRFRFVTWPGIAFAALLASLYSALWIFRDVDVVFASTGGGPAGATLTLSLYVYDQAFQFFRMGTAAAAGLFMIAAAVIASGITFAAVGRGRF